MAHKFRLLRPHYKAAGPDGLINREEFPIPLGCSHCIVCTFLEEGFCQVCNQQFY